MTTTLDIAALASAVLYPIVLLVIILLFRKEIPTLLKKFSGRLTKLEVAGISLELAKAEAFDPNWVKEGTLDLRHKAASININDSTAGNFLSQLKAGGRLCRCESWEWWRMAVFSLIHYGNHF